MAKSQEHKTEITPLIKERVQFQERKGLFGLLTWNEEIKREVIGNVLHIITTQEPGEVYLNGRLIN